VKRERDGCAACGSKPVVRQTTFMVDRPGTFGEFHICAKCWEEGQNNEAWNEAITQRIIARLGQARRIERKRAAKAGK
jgi:hypothetical protein